MTSAAKIPPAQVNTTLASGSEDTDSENRGHEMTEEQITRLTAERDNASGEEKVAKETAVRAAKGKLDFNKNRKERRRQESQAKLDAAVAPKPFDGALYSATGRRAEGDRKTEFEDLMVLLDEKEKKGETKRSVS